MRTWTIVLFIILLNGCAGTGNNATLPVYYLLPLPEQALVDKALPDSAPLLLVARIELADHLRQPGIVYATSTTEVVNARLHQWASPIAGQLSQRLLTDLRHKQDLYRIEPTSERTGNIAAATLHLRLTKLNGVHTGHAELRGEWAITASGSSATHSSGFDIKVALTEDGYPALVEALSLAVDQLTTAIAADLQ
ncbi:PqiC family protein [Motiliproteus sediminis]|uniref:PqiC family protein n=1 Tax=Motiliproteus sediminis TaxID=1468178 RepID=UPI001AEF812A|nr:ABC-type transport auxiliary lipoprotein family protein [Motiliproteus sediminis]